MLNLLYAHPALELCADHCDLFSEVHLIQLPDDALSVKCAIFLIPKFILDDELVLDHPIDFV